MCVFEREREGMSTTTSTALVFCSGHLNGAPPRETEFFIENLPVGIHLLIVMIRWTGLAPWEFEFRFSSQPYITFFVVANGAILHTPWGFG